MDFPKIGRVSFSSHCLPCHDQTIYSKKNISDTFHPAFQKGLQLPGSKIDVIRTKSLSGPSPVGGAIGGFETKNIAILDEFELQAANYNMACAYAQLGQVESALTALRASFDAGFDNYATVRADPDLTAVQSTDAFRALLDEYEPKTRGFNPFGFFGGRK
jgi:hypothetical protein